MSEKKLDELIADERRAYYREWRAKNKDKVKKHNADYWKRRAEKRAVAEQEVQG